MERLGLFVFSGSFYAVPLITLRKIVHQQNGYLLPKLPLAVSEVLVENKQLIPLVALPGQDLGRISENRGAEYKVLVESEAGTIALPADETCGIIAAHKGELLPAEEGESAGIKGRFNYQSTDYHILDIDFLALRMTQVTDKVA
ncbi:Chemotaxis signal transduction protein [Malonomonas rubra DSM 5091]|uniref:Chemotaxis signal transduction protein n=1 Tax=Malonomonas rubra DSM 5091 TaxID=1122189 RepID=A0A1M6BXD4_MALRU|nr:chemotaxis protein CheW [Malonomonas rubra]SHI53357.1 Chemotaxis signal transduction protein [Malonomonas rubra DSM 5091]